MKNIYNLEIINDYKAFKKKNFQSSESVVLNNDLNFTAVMNGLTKDINLGRISKITHTGSLESNLRKSELIILSHHNPLMLSYLQDYIPSTPNTESQSIEYAIYAFGDPLIKMNIGNVPFSNQIYSGDHIKLDLGDEQLLLGTVLNLEAVKDLKIIHLNTRLQQDKLLKFREHYNMNNSIIL